ncbi:hypothetical protein A8990_107143 [Paenibacillus taihuensis]|uniref:Uncharacterized protein n=1 Tax=Paenibacillus taihuensis TaxID=1156355 RepID=A0A3D9S7D0_9BACL|nr:hypothetical protein [Paenibacillus taihuensis]REE89047.1 hypothetical protein A8990_107143 [Paenibacillus taihuensis]
MRADQAGREIVKWFSIFMLNVFFAVILYVIVGAAINPVGIEDELICIGIVLSIQCSFIITLLFYLIGVQNKKRGGSRS